MNSTNNKKEHKMDQKKLDVIVALALPLLMLTACMALIIFSFVLGLPLWDKLLNILLFAYMLVRSLIFLAFECDELWE